jgi:hypothetical protein
MAYLLKPKGDAIVSSLAAFIFCRQESLSYHGFSCLVSSISHQ